MEIKFEDIQRANETIKTTDIKGKEYAEVNQRIKAFRMIYPQGAIKTEMLSNENGTCIFQASVSDKEGNVLGTGTAYEKEGSSFINKTSYIENCETSAVGRALGMAGFGIDTSVASAEEVQNAMAQQEQKEVQDMQENIINKSKLDALNKAIENRKITDDKVLEVLNKYDYMSTSEIKMKDYMNIVNDFQKIAEK